MAKRQWDIRHARTGVMLGWLDIDIDPQYLDPAASPRPYTFAVMPSLPEVLDSLIPGDIVGPSQCPRERPATVRIDTRCRLGQSTLWVDKASELYRVPGFMPWW